MEAVIAGVVVPITIPVHSGGPSIFNLVLKPVEAVAIGVLFGILAGALVFTLGQMLRELLTPPFAWDVPLWQHGCIAAASLVAAITVAVSLYRPLTAPCVRWEVLNHKVCAQPMGQPEAAAECYDEQVRGACLEKAP